MFSDALVEPLAQVLMRLGSEHVLVVHSEDGMDEISIGAASHVAELKDGEIRDYMITPEEFGFKRTDIAVLAVDSAAHSLAVIRDIFSNKAGPARDIVAMNAGAAIYAAGLTSDLDKGIKTALAVIADGSANAKLDGLVAMSKSFQ